ncbi:MAG TPA: chemotaxis protein CheW [Candidatus Kapabacteria bacterium]|nr:chemotaxis protein CheW [Candidatus Kapabacteria bacterium]
MSNIEQHIENFKETCRRHCDIIETCLLDYEKYRIAELLANTANSINQIRLSAKKLSVDNAAIIADAMLKVVSLAKENRLDLLPNDIDLILRANDFYYSIIQFSAYEILELLNSEFAIISEIAAELQSIAAPQRIKKVQSTVVKSETTSDEQQSKGILLEKFKYAIVRSVSTIEQVLEQSETQKEAIDVVPISQALNTIKGAAISAGVSKAFDLADAMGDFIRFLAENNVPINPYQMDLLLSCNRLFKEIAATSAIAIIDKIKDYSDYIDTYSDFLRSFLTEQEHLQPTPSAKLASDEIVPLISTVGASSDAASDGKLYYFGYKSSQLNDYSKYNRLLDATINIISNIVPISSSINNLKSLKSLIRQIQLDNNNILYNITNTEVLTEIAMNNAKKLEEIISQLDFHFATADEFLQNIKNRINTIYNGLYNFRSVAFGDVVRGYNELANDLARYSSKKVNLKITGRFVRVGSELYTLLEILLPQLLRDIIINNIEPPNLRKGKPEVAEISLSARTLSGKLLIEIIDDGKGVDASAISARLEGLINLIRNNSGRIDISSEPNFGTKLSISFNMNYVLLKSLVFEVAGNLYAVQLLNCEALIDEKTFHKQHSNAKSIDMRKILGVEAEYIGKNKPVLLVNDFNGNIALIFDKFVGEAELVPTPANKLVSVTPFIAASSVYNNKPVMIIDVQKLLNISVN